jgi:hypothetical protein
MNKMEINKKQADINILKTSENSVWNLVKTIFKTFILAALSTEHNAIPRNPKRWPDGRRRFRWHTTNKNF